MIRNFASDAALFTAAFFVRNAIVLTALSVFAFVVLSRA
jgi:hypothetical protein